MIVVCSPGLVLILAAKQLKIMPVPISMQQLHSFLLPFFNAQYKQKKANVLYTFDYAGGISPNSLAKCHRDGGQFKYNGPLTPDISRRWPPVLALMKRYRKEDPWHQSRGDPNRRTYKTNWVGRMKPIVMEILFLLAQDVSLTEEKAIKMLEEMRKDIMNGGEGEDVEGGEAGDRVLVDTLARMLNKQKKYSKKLS